MQKIKRVVLLLACLMMARPLDAAGVKPKESCCTSCCSGVSRAQYVTQGYVSSLASYPCLGDAAVANMSMMGNIDSVDFQNQLPDFNGDLVGTDAQERKSSLKDKRTPAINGKGYGMHKAGVCLKAHPTLFKCASVLVWCCCAPCVACCCCPKEQQQKRKSVYAPNTSVARNDVVYADNSSNHDPSSQQRRSRRATTGRGAIVGLPNYNQGSPSQRPLTSKLTPLQSPLSGITSPVGTFMATAATLSKRPGASSVLVFDTNKPLVVESPILVTPPDDQFISPLPSRPPSRQGTLALDAVTSLPGSTGNSPGKFESTTTTQTASLSPGAYRPHAGSTDSSGSNNADDRIEQETVA